MRADLFKANSLKMITGNITAGINGIWMYGRIIRGLSFERGT